MYSVLTQMFNRVWIRSMKRSWRRFSNSLAQVEQTQTGLLEALLSRHAQTRYGTTVSFLRDQNRCRLSKTGSIDHL